MLSIFVFDSFFDSFFIANFYVQYQFFFRLVSLYPILPESVLLFFILHSLISLFHDPSTKKNLYRWSCYFLIIFLLLVVTLMNSVTTFLYFGFSFIFCWFSQISKLFLLVFTGILLIFSKKKLFINYQFQLMREFSLVLAFSILFLFFLMSTYDFFSVYLVIEGLSLTLYVLASILSHSIVSLEASIKYFSLGAVSTGIFLFGLSFLYGLVGSVDFLEIQLFLNQSFYLVSFCVELKVSFFCIIFGLFFKLAAFPCHWWIVDVYEGVWLPITAFFAIVIKLAFFLFFFRFIFNLLFSIIFVYQPLFLISGLGSLFIGVFGAIRQVRVKRFLAYTSISQVGFIFLGLSCCSIGGLIASIVYLLLYSVSSLALFAIFLNTLHVGTKKPIFYLCELYFFSSTQIRPARYLSLIFLSMAGLPPLGGFLGKLLIFICLMEVRLDITILITLLFSIISSFYYLNFIHYLWFVKYSKLKLFFFTPSFTFDIFLQILSSLLVLFVWFFPTIYLFALTLAYSCLWPYVHFN